MLLSKLSQPWNARTEIEFCAARDERGSSMCMHFLVYACLEGHGADTELSRFCVKLSAGARASILSLVL
jgi:hypothetical protein